MQEAIQGAFLPDDSNSIAVGLYVNVIKQISRFGKGYSPDIIQSLFGKLYNYEAVLDMLPATH
jgi:hypothetical protein